MKAFIKIDVLSRITPSRPSSIRAEDSHYWAHQTRTAYYLVRVVTAAVLVGAAALTFTVLRVWLVT